MFIRADAAFAIAADEFLAGVVDRDHPRMRNALRRILFILGEALLFDLAVCLLERAVSLFLFFFLLETFADFVSHSKSIWWPIGYSGVNSDDGNIDNNTDNGDDDADNGSGDNDDDGSGDNNDDSSGDNDDDGSGNNDSDVGSGNNGFFFNISHILYHITTQEEFLASFSVQ